MVDTASPSRGASERRMRCWFKSNLMGQNVVDLNLGGVAKCPNPREGDNRGAASRAEGSLRHLNKMRDDNLSSGEMIYLLAVRVPTRHLV